VEDSNGPNLNAEGDNIILNTLVDIPTPESHSESHSINGAHQMNMRGVFLHVLGDALSSVAVIAASGVTIAVSRPTPPGWVMYLDPIISLLISALVFHASIPLVMQATVILLQRAPATVDLAQIRSILENTPGVVGIHELHVWELVSGKTIATVHLSFRVSEMCAEDYATSVAQIKEKMHQAGIHSITVQPEFVADNASMELERTEKDVRKIDISVAL
jgi:zinc transporter 1